MKKSIDPDDTYIVRELFACGEGHFLSPPHTYWEEGEVCPHGHDENATNRDVHLYYRLIMVPTVMTDRDGGGDLWENMLKNPDCWGQLPIAPEGAEEGDKIGTKVKH